MLTSYDAFGQGHRTVTVDLWEKHCYSIKCVHVEFQEDFDIYLIFFDSDMFKMFQ